MLHIFTNLGNRPFLERTHQNYCSSGLHLQGNLRVLIWQVLQILLWQKSRINIILGFFQHTCVQSMFNPYYTFS